MYKITSSSFHNLRGGKQPKTLSTTASSLNFVLLTSKQFYLVLLFNHLALEIDI